MTIEVEVHCNSGNRTEKGTISLCAVFNLLYLRAEKTPVRLHEVKKKLHISQMCSTNQQKQIHFW